MTLLVRHPDTPPGAIHAIDAELVRTADGFVATFKAIGDTARLVLPSPASPDRADDLWKTTCFEAFIQAEGETAYREYNFAPSGDWAAYDFTGPREGMAEAPLSNPPYIRIEDNLTWWSLGATFTLEAGRRWALGLSAVIEEADGAKSYWALAHGGEKPDFHDPACFTARLG